MAQKDIRLALIHSFLLMPPNDPEHIAEDDPRWNPQTMGNRRGRIVRRRKGQLHAYRSQHGIPQGPSWPGLPNRDTLS